MKTSGLMLDLYDDPRGEVLKAFYPTQHDVPAVVKTASVLNQDALKTLPDDLFALVMHNDDQVLRKYACFDAGNTAVSVLYFLKTAHKLPGEAQKIAASNLLTACDWYDLEAPEQLSKIASGRFEKTALGLGTALTVAAIPSQIQGTGERIKENLGATKQVQRMTGNPIVTPVQMRQARIGSYVKTADVPNTYLMPGQPPKQVRRQFVPKKTASAATADSIVKAKQYDRCPEVNYESEDEENPQRAPQVKTSARLRPWFEVSGETPKLHLEKAAHRYALPNKYPLDNYAQVKAASAYFDEYKCRFAPAERHEYCKNLVKRAEQLGIKMNDEIRKYGSTTFAPHHEICMALDSRRNVLVDENAHTLLDKLADARHMLRPALFCATLEEFDKVAGIDRFWGSHIFDPFFSTYGFEKTAEDLLEDFADVIGNLRVTGAQLEMTSRAGRKSLIDLFGEDFADEFKKDPVAIYKSMPREQKIVIINLSQDLDNGRST